MLDLTGSGDSVHKPLSRNVVDIMSPPPSAFCLLGSDASSTPACGPAPPFQSELPFTDGTIGGAATRSFQWPGIDAVMESYQLYLEGNVLCSLYGWHNWSASMFPLGSFHIDTVIKLVDTELKVLD